MKKAKELENRKAHADVMVKLKMKKGNYVGAKKWFIEFKNLFTSNLTILRKIFVLHRFKI